MKKKILFILLIAVLLIAIPVSAKGREPVGDQISLWPGGSTAYPANTPFHIKHGWLLENLRLEGPLGAHDFYLEVDGVMVAPDFTERTISSGPPPKSILFLRVFNFPTGMTGTHTFTGYWYGPCRLYAPDPSTCTNPNEPVQAHVRSLTVTFTP